MFNFRVMAVVKRELKDKLLSKGFIISTLLIPIFMVGIIGFQAFVQMFEGGKTTSIIFATESSRLNFLLEEEFAEKSYVEEGDYIFTFEVVRSDEFQQYLESKKQDITDGKISNIAYMSNENVKEKIYQLYGQASINRQISSKLNYAVNNVLIDEYLRDKSITTTDLDYIRKGVDSQGFKVSGKEEVQKENVGNMILAFLFAFLLYMSLLISGQKILGAIIEEKATRIVEVLLSSISATELMTGKIIGNTIVGLVQMAIWISPILLLTTTSIFALPAEIVLDISPLMLLYFLFIYFLGVMTFFGMFAAVGSLYENPQDAQSGMWPIMLLIMLPFFISISMVTNPTTIIGEYASFTPFFSLIVMPVRMTLIDVPVWQMLVATVVQIGTLIVIFPLAGKIFKVAILKTGKKPSIKDLRKWLKAGN
ncbi:MAG: ABC transporter permease [Melioribacteraceae bacterium]|nr:ABC transporter permease [Melioribacteraceae bacterium]MCF8262962.1 ABC transporter permease [Melioribacteraceae bacterium]MCF8413329.1 ABC transporter permease [Melioribacteraceae bacterium]MCF8430605.1 ABC transporter permease [Melioribacteraceae bacterium]